MCFVSSEDTKLSSNEVSGELSLDSLCGLLCNVGATSMIYTYTYIYIRTYCVYYILVINSVADSHGL